jgi:hypothetical protein
MVCWWNLNHIYIEIDFFVKLCDNSKMKKFITILISFLIVQSSFVFAGTPEIKTNANGKKYYEEV